MLQQINLEKQQVIKISSEGCVKLWLDAAEVCRLTYACPFKPNTRLTCRKPSEIGVAWKQCPGPANQKRMAFIFNYYGTEVYRHALSTTHQEETAERIMTSMGIVMDVGPTGMRLGQKTCIQQQYSCCAKNTKNNILRAGWATHCVRVNLEQGATQTKQNYKRPKEVFFNTHINPTGERVVEKVSPNCRIMCVCWHLCG